MAEFRLPPDPVLPYLSHALDGKVMKEVFSDKLVKRGSGSSACIDSCEIFHTRYKRGRYCMVAYRLNIRPLSSGSLYEQILCGRMVEPGGALSRFRKALTEELVPPRFGEPLFILPNLNMVVWAFPNDRKLSGLPGLLDTTRLRHHVAPTLIHTHMKGQWTIQDVRPSVIHYVGEHTCTIQLSVRLSHLTSSNRATATFFGKTYYNDEGEQAFRAMKKLQRALSHKPPGLAIATPVLYEPETRTLWQSALPGKTLLEENFRLKGGEHLLLQAGSALATLHQTPLSDISHSTREDRLGLLTQTRTVLLDVVPQWKSVLAHIVHRLLTHVPPTTLQPQATLHGDLHLQNFFVTPDGVTFIDLDTLHHGSPYWDLGTVLSNLYYQALVEHKPVGQGSRWASSFLDAYESRISWPLSRRTLAWHVAYALMTERIYRCGTRLKAGRLDLIPQLLSLADQITQQQHPFCRESSVPSNPFIVSQFGGSDSPQPGGDRTDRFLDHAPKSERKPA